MGYTREGIMGRCTIDPIPASTEGLRQAIKREAIENMYGHPPRTDPVFLSVTMVHPSPRHWDKEIRRQATEGLIHYTGRSNVIDLLPSIIDALEGIFFADRRQIVRYEIRNEYGDPQDTEPYLYVLCPTIDFWKRITGQATH